MITRKWCRYHDNPYHVAPTWIPLLWLFHLAVNSIQQFRMEKQQKINFIESARICFLYVLSVTSLISRPQNSLRQLDLDLKNKYINFSLQKLPVLVSPEKKNLKKSKYWQGYTLLKAADGKHIVWVNTSTLPRHRDSLSSVKCTFGIIKYFKSRKCSEAILMKIVFFFKTFLYMYKYTWWPVTTRLSLCALPRRQNVNKFLNKRH